MIQTFGSANMKTYAVLILASVILSFGGTKDNNSEKWFMKASYHEGCSCNAPCPCPFGLPMTNPDCTLNGLVDIHEGRYGSVNLKGIKVILSGTVGKWGEYYFSENTSEEQKQALEKILQTIRLTSFTTIVKSERAKIAYSNHDGKVSYSTPNIKVELESVKGRNGKAVVVQNLFGKLYEKYIPHLSVINERNFPDTTHNFSFEQKAGFTAEWNISGEDFH